MSRNHSATRSVGCFVSLTTATIVYECKIRRSDVKRSERIVFFLTLGFLAAAMFGRVMLSQPRWHSISTVYSVYISMKGAPMLRNAGGSGMPSHIFRQQAMQIASFRRGSRNITLIDSCEVCNNCLCLAPQETSFWVDMILLNKLFAPIRGICFWSNFRRIRLPHFRPHCAT